MNQAIITRSDAAIAAGLADLPATTGGLAGNLCIRLHEPMRLDRGDHRLYSPVKWSIVHSIADRPLPNG